MDLCLGKVLFGVNASWCYNVPSLCFVGIPLYCVPITGYISWLCC